MKKILEKNIQKSICDYLFARGFFFWRNNTIPVFSEGRFRALPKYTPRGLPDIICLHRGKFYGIEVKRPENIGGNPKTKKAQDDMKEKITRAGGVYKVVFSKEDFITAFPELI